MRAVAYVGLVSCLLLAASLPFPVIVTGRALLGVGFGFRALMRRLFPTEGTISP